MILITVWYENPALVGLIIGAPMAILGFLGWMASKDRDEAVKEAGIASGQAVWIGQVQEDNRELRERVGTLEERLDAVEAGSNDLRDKNRDLESENAKLHAEIEELRAENVTLKARIDELEEKANGGGGSRK